MGLRYLSDDGYALGMMRDEPSWLLPKGAVYDALNLVWDKPGIARQRGPTTALVSGAQTAFATSIGFCYSQDATPIEELYGYDGKTGNVYVISKTTGAATLITGWNAGVVGRPVRHFGFVVFPLSDRSMLGLAGQTTATTFVNTALASVTAGNQQVTLTGADVTSNVKVGAVVKITDTPQTYHFARVVSVDTSKLFTIWPAPVWTSATIPVGNLVLAPAYGITGAGRCAASFQNRLLFGNTTDHNSVGQTLITDRRIYYSILPTEATPVPFPMFVAATLAGASFLDPRLWPSLNYFDVSGADPIVAMEPVSGNQLLILTSSHPVVFSGNLTTQLATTSPTITYDLSDINVNAGCLSDLSVQRTSHGIVWAGPGGIYAWDGRQPVDLTASTINTYWRGLVNGSSFAVHGSAYARGYYLISGTSGGAAFALMADLNTKNPKWTRASGAGTDIFYGIQRPTTPAQVFAARWWDQAGAAPSMTNGQTVRLETMLSPDPVPIITAKLDSDGNTVPFSATTRVLTGDAETQKLFQRGTVRYQAEYTANSIDVTGQSKIDAADIDASSVRSLTSLGSTVTSTITNATNANPIVVTTSVSHGLLSDDFVDIDAVLGNLNANGRWRIVKINGTQFSLVGPGGSGAYISGGKVKKLTESDFSASALNAGQGASLTISGTAANKFELHGVRLAVLERPPVMSS